MSCGGAVSHGRHPDRCRSADLDCPPNVRRSQDHRRHAGGRGWSGLAPRKRSADAIFEDRPRLTRLIRGRASHHLGYHWALRKIEKRPNSLTRFAGLAILETQDEHEQRTAGHLIAVARKESG